MGLIPHEQPIELENFMISRFIDAGSDLVFYPAVVAVVAVVIVILYRSSR